MIPESQSDLRSRLSDDAYRRLVWDGFAVDAWLGNWDCVGQDFEHVLSDGAGCPWRVDMGGALLFRAMGVPKGAAFGPRVSEWHTLRDSQINRTASIVFNGMTAAELKRSAERVRSVDDAEIRRLVGAFGFDRQLADVLVARREDVLKRAGSDMARVDASHDVPRTAVGWRYWTLGMSGTLYSLTHATDMSFPWAPDRITYATCARHSKPPITGCGCGIYFCGDVGSLSGGMRRAARRLAETGRDSGVLAVVGRVEIVGDITTGFRPPLCAGERAASGGRPVGPLFIRPNMPAAAVEACRRLYDTEVYAAPDIVIPETGYWSRLENRRACQLQGHLDWIDDLPEQTAAAGMVDV